MPTILSVVLADLKRLVRFTRRFKWTISLSGVLVLLLLMVAGSTTYRECISRLRAEVADPHLFVFSDDIAWAKCELSAFDSITFVEHNRTEEDYEDLRLMSLCRHAIIANSSFSWWGAWLKANDIGMTITPEPWFDKKTIPTADLIPGTWLKIPK